MEKTFLKKYFLKEIKQASIIWKSLASVANCYIHEGVYDNLQLSSVWTKICSALAALGLLEVQSNVRV